MNGQPGHRCGPGDAVPHCADLHPHDTLTRRGLIRTAGAAAVAGAAGSAAGAAALPVPAAATTGRPKPDPDSYRFTLAVMPDTQYLFDDDRGDHAPLDASLRWLLDHAAERNIVFLAHLGDLTEHGHADELDRIGRSFRVLDRAGARYSVLAGNHDVGGATDDQRGPSPYLEVFGPHRNRPTGASPDGYNTFHVFRAAGRDWLVLALDWRLSPKGFGWAQAVLDRHPTLPVILTTHELAFADDRGEAHLSDYGRTLWDRLVNANDKIFLTLNGHFWPPGRTVLRNAAGHDVHVHVTNYQDRYYGGSAMIRLYHFDLARDTIDVETFSPHFSAIAPAKRTALQKLDAELTGPVNRFSLAIDFDARFGGFGPAPLPPPRPARDVLVRGTVAYWRFDGHRAGTPVTDTIRDLSGQGNHLTRVTVGGDASVLAFADSHHRDQPAHASLRFDGAKNPARGAYLRTADGARLNGLTFDRGYTIEAFVKLPADFDAHAWCGVLTRMGTGRDAGKTADDPSEPAATLNLSDGGGAQWAVYPRRPDRLSTNWGHELPREQWWHLAVVNDGTHTVMYVDGCPVVRNPATPAPGIATANRFWMLGAYHYDNVVEQTFYGWLGDVRIVDRALPVQQFLNRPR